MPTTTTPRTDCPLNPTNIVPFSEGRTLDLHIAANSGSHVLAYDNGLRAVSVAELELMFKSNSDFPRSIQRGGWKTTQCPAHYGSRELQTVASLLKAGRTVMVSYSPTTPFQHWDVTDVVANHLASVSLTELLAGGGGGR